MFTVADVKNLRDQLGPLDFSKPTQHDTLTASYLHHYGLPPHSNKLQSQHFIGYISSQDYQIACQYFTPMATDNPRVAVLTHGYFDHVGLYRHLIELLLGLDISVLAFDLPGHGLSSGKEVSIKSFDQYHRVLIDCLYKAAPVLSNKQCILLGQSTGASVLIHGLQQGHSLASTPAKIILLAPLVRPVNLLRVKFMYLFMHKFVSSVARDFVDSSHDEEFLQFIKTEDPFQSSIIATEWVHALLRYLSEFKQAPINNSALHVIQGTDDETVDWENNMRLLKDKFPAVDICLIPGARHHMVNESTPYRDKIFAEIERIVSD